jgi:hypothetical protein
MVLYPNPTDGQLTVLGSEEELSELRILNALGQEVTGLVTLVSINAATLSLDLTGLASGMYHVRTRTSVATVSKL